MKTRRLRGSLVASSSVAVALSLGTAPNFVSAGAPWDIFGMTGGQKVEANKDKSYELTDRSGDWLIYVGSFAGEGSRDDALELLHELRSRHALESFLYKVEFDYGGTQEGLGFNDEFNVDGTPKPRKMRHLNDEKIDEYAVMVGGFASLEDPRMDQTLTKIKHLHPECLKLEEGETTTKTLFDLRAIRDKLNLSAEVKGPLRAAFKTRNPLLPESYYNTKGVSKLVEKLNSDFEYSLLDNPGLWTVRVATFQGKRAVSLEKDYEKLMKQDVSDSLYQAAMKAHELTLELRRQGVEAYQFHDETKSIVTVGAYQEVGKPLPDGRTEMNDDIYRVIEVFKPAPAGVAGAMMPKQMKGISFDIQPWPMEVPKRSIASSYLSR
ncbi:MAG TPA: hypothetical protein VGN57_12585 [Pirellulaceae bacterium]|jgi:hypothetical protein|nr:hypothetical protein [Pirellulaceae bacterium]